MRCMLIIKYSNCMSPIQLLIMYLGYDSGRNNLMNSCVFINRNMQILTGCVNLRGWMDVVQLAHKDYFLLRLDCNYLHWESFE